MSMVDLLKRIYAHDREALYGSMRPDFTVHSPGQNLIAGTYVGAEAFKAHMQKMQALCNHTFEEELQDTFLANDTWGLVVHRMTAERNGKHLDTWGFGLWRFEDGQLTDHWENWESVGDQAHWDDFWS
jgi:ketosteroid isomerase-like protein